MSGKPLIGKTLPSLADLNRGNIEVSEHFPQPRDLGKIGSMPKERLLSAVFLILFSAFSFSVAAQAQDDRNESDVVKRETTAEKQVSRASEKARDKKSLETVKDVTFEEVLMDPDNVKLNFAFAQAQVAKNDLLGAASSLERILMVNPDLHEIRLFYTRSCFTVWTIWPKPSANWVRLPRFRCLRP